MRCYLSGEELTEQNSTVEHIIHDSMGGKLKSSQIMTAEWNNKLGRTIDAELSRQIRLADLMQLPKRNESRNIVGSTIDGQQYFIHPGGQTGESYPTPPTIILDSEGNERLEIKGDKAIKDYKRGLRKKYPELSEDELAKMYIEIPPSNNDKVVYNQVFKSLAGPECFRAIAKIAANFYVYSAEDITQVQPLVEFIKSGEKGQNWNIFPYYIIEVEEFDLPKKEIFHLLYLCGDSISKILYCYIELFNVHNYIVILNCDYSGKDLKYFFRQNLHTGEYDFDNFPMNIEAESIRMFNPEDRPLFKQAFQKRIEHFLVANDIRSAGFLNKDKFESP